MRMQGAACLLSSCICQVRRGATFQPHKSNAAMTKSVILIGASFAQVPCR